MQRIEIPFNELKLFSFKFWSDGLLLTAGVNEPGKFNTMTIGWGNLGFMWKRPTILVGVRPTRYTYQFMEKYETFTVCRLSAQYQKALDIMGTKSGRDMDKVKESQLTPHLSVKVAAPGYDEAELIIECRKMYYDDLHPGNADGIINGFYHGREYHRFYFGEVVAVYGQPFYQE